MTKKTQKKLRKALLLISCAALLVCITVGVTVAYLTDSKSVKNTFSVGKVGIDLNETDVDGDSNTKENKYHLMPGQSYVKDPTISIDDNSELAYLRVKVAFENSEKAADLDIDLTQLFACDGECEFGCFHGDEWKKVVETTDADGDLCQVWYFTDFIDGDTGDLTLFDKVVVPDGINNADLLKLDNIDMVLVAEAVQAEGFATDMSEWTLADAQSAFTEAFGN